MLRAHGNGKALFLRTYFQELHLCALRCLTPEHACVHHRLIALRYTVGNTILVKRKREMTASKPSSDRDEQQGPERWYKSTPYQVLWHILLFLGGLALYLLLGLFLWWLLQRYVDPSAIKDPSNEATAKKDLLQALAFIMAGVAGAIGIFFTWRGQSQARDAHEQTQRLTEQGQITERFTRAIDQLGATDDEGNKKLEIRLGGIYALERIAWDSLAMETSSGRDYSTVMEILAAYVRENTYQALWPSEGASGESSSLHPLRRWLRSQSKPLAPPEPPRPTADIQAILDVLRRSQARAPKEFRTRFDFRQATLQGADLKGADLQGANLHRADLRKALLQGADLLKARLQYADLREADLRKVKVTDKQVDEVRSLQGATMPEGWVHS